MQVELRREIGQQHSALTGNLEGMWGREEQREDWVEREMGTGSGY